MKNVLYEKVVQSRYNVSRLLFPFALNVNRFFNTRHGQCFQSCMVVGCCSSMFHLPDNFQEACSSTNQPNQWLYSASADSSSRALALESSGRGDGSLSGRLRWLRGTVSSLQHCRDWTLESVARNYTACKLASQTDMSCSEWKNILPSIKGKLVWSIEIYLALFTYLEYPSDKNLQSYVI